jgi:hypothetical protein
MLPFHPTFSEYYQLCMNAIFCLQNLALIALVILMLIS